MAELLGKTINGSFMYLYTSFQGNIGTYSLVCMKHISTRSWYYSGLHLLTLSMIHSCWT